MQNSLFFHILFALTLFGMSVGNYYYVVRAIATQDRNFLLMAYQFSIRVDWILILPLIFLTVMTGTVLLKLIHLPIATPWIFFAYLLFFVAILCWFVTVLFKIKHRQELLMEDVFIPFSENLFFHLFYALYFILFITVLYKMVLKG